jgi:hypothetical protein
MAAHRKSVLLDSGLTRIREPDGFRQRLCLRTAAAPECFLAGPARHPACYDACRARLREGGA